MLNQLSFVVVLIQSLSSSVIIIQDVWLSGVTVKTSEMLKSFSASSSSDQNSILSKWIALSELIEGQTLTSSFLNSSSSFTSELESANSHLWNNKKSLVVQNWSYNYQQLLSLLLSLSVFHQSAKRDRITVYVTLVKSLVYHSVEFRFGSSCQEGIKFNQKLVIVIGCGGCSHSSFLTSSSIEINTHVDL